MSVTFDQIIGPRSMLYPPGSWGLYLQDRAYRDYRANEIPSAMNRASTRYITQSASGDAAGGGGMGTIGQPYLVRHMADLKTFIAAMSFPGGGNVGIVIPDDVVIPGVKANTDQSVVNTVANISWGRGGLGTRRPEMSWFVSVQPDSVAAGVATFNLGAGVTCYGVRGRTAASTTRDDYNLQDYKYGATAIESAANTYSFFSVTGTGVTTVTFGAHDTTRLELSFNTGPGLDMSDFDQCAVDGIIFNGAGMHQRGAAGSGLCLKFSNTGTNTGIARDCDWTHGPYHVGGQIVTGTGGIVTVHRCRWGFNQWDSAGTGDGCINFASGGGQEFGRYGCSQPWGGLDTVAGVALPQTAYGHSGNDITLPVAYGCEIDCTYAPTVGIPLASNTVSASVGAVTNKDLSANYRIRTYNRSVTSKGISSGGFRAIHNRGTNTILMVPPAGAFYVAFTGNEALRGLWFNTELSLVTSGAWTTKGIRVFQSATTGGANPVHDFRWCFSRFRVTGTIAVTGALNVGGDFSGLGYFKTCSLENTAISNETAITAANFTMTTNDGSDHFWNTNPRVNTGGFSGCATWGCQASQFNATLGTLALAAAADWVTAATVPAAMLNAALPLPTGLTCEFDYLGAFRSGLNGSRSRGPIEGNPTPYAPVSASQGGRSRNWRMRCPR